MCGITGKIYFALGKRVDKEEIRQMNEKIKHRGPDDEGIYINPNGNVGLGHRRLSIIDLSPAGHQPMSNENGTVWITLNGEIYNFQELRHTLEKRGHKFKSNTDTEVIVHLWEDYGEECLQYLRGMFAFAIWDEQKQKLFLARDRAGKKPLKYYIGADFIVFASELKAFINMPGVSREPDFEAIHHYLALQYVPHPLTGFKNVRKLPAAHYILIDLSKPFTAAQPKRYWKLDFAKKEHHSTEEWKEKLLACLDESVRLRMISDVPLGAFLSGGIDSSAIVALMAKHCPKPIKTFSIGFEAKNYNELPYARAIARQFATDHTEFIVKPNAIEILPKLVYHYEEPYADSSALPTYYLSELTRKYVTVALNGDGGDENFAGYPMFWFHMLGCEFYEKIPKFLREQIFKNIFHLMARFKKNMLFYRAERFNQSFERSRLERYLYYVAYFSPEERERLYTKKFPFSSIKQETTGLVAQICQTAGTNHPLEQVLTYNFESYLANDLLPKVDLATMAFGLEGRSPFLDHHLVELASRMPPELKLRGKEKKYILKQALKDILPPNIIHRKKQGFGLPVEFWFRGPLLPYLKEQLLGGALVQSGMFNSQSFQAIIEQHQKTKINFAPQLWALLTLELWWRIFFHKS